MFFQTDTHVPFLYKQLAILALYKRIVNMAQMSYHKLWCKQWFHVCVMSCFNIYLLITQHFKIKFKSPFYQINKYSTQQNQAQYCLCLVFDKPPKMDAKKHGQCRQLSFIYPRSCSIFFSSFSYVLSQ